MTATLTPETEEEPRPPEKEEGEYTGTKVFAAAIILILVAGAITAIAIGDGGSNATTDATSEATTGGGAAATASGVEIGMGDDFFKPAAVTSSAGKVRISAVNNGQITHEMVLAKTNAKPGSLPTKPDGSVNEDVLNSPGEIPDVAAGKTKSATIALKPGKYVMFCNIPGHYTAGMYGSFTAK